MSTQAFDASCKKCGAEMKPFQQPVSGRLMDYSRMTVTAYRCDCGHWNDLKRRKGWKEHQQQEQK